MIVITVRLVGFMIDSPKISKNVGIYRYKYGRRFGTIASVYGNFDCKA